MIKRLFIIISIAFVCFTACEDIYNPDIDEMEDLLVIEARLVYGQSSNYVKLFKTIGFNDFKDPYPPVTKAIVSLVDNNGATIALTETEKGTYQLSKPLVSTQMYKIQISAGGEKYESPFQTIPDIPSLDDVYLSPSEQLIVGATDEAASNLQKTPGAQLYADITGKGDANYYRFTGRKICQYTYNRVTAPGSPFEIPIYAWLSMGPLEIFNIAAPPEYSVSDDIRKHPLVFLEKSYRVFLPDTVTYFSGWIYICQQYAISEQTYNFYSDLKKQLSAGGKIFDPLYTQARGNISCVSTPGKVVLGNFEIASVREYRFYVEPTGQDIYFIKRIPYFWDIPQEGRIQYQAPVWWETRNKEYPAGK
jgi:hypothetical protein